MELHHLWECRKVKKGFFLLLFYVKCCIYGPIYIFMPMVFKLWTVIKSFSGKIRQTYLSNIHFCWKNKAALENVLCLIPACMSYICVWACPSNSLTPLTHIFAQTWTCLWELFMFMCRPTEQDRYHGPVSDGLFLISAAAAFEDGGTAADGVRLRRRTWCKISACRVLF